MRRHALWIGAAVVAVAGAVAYGLLTYPDQALRSAVDTVIKTLPPGYTASYEGARYSLLARRAVLSGLTLRGPGPWLAELTIAEIEVAGPNLGFADAWAKAAANPSALSLDTVLPIADSIVARTLALKGERVNGTVGSSRVDGARVHPAALLGRDLPSWDAAMAPLVKPPEQLTPADVLPMLRLGAAWLFAVASDHYETDAVSSRIAMPNNPMYPDGEVSYQLRRSIVGPRARGKIAHASSEGMVSNNGSTLVMSLEAMTASDVDVERPVTRLLAGEPLDWSMLDGLSVGKIDYRGVSLGAMAVIAAKVENSGPVPVDPDAGRPTRVAGMTLADLRFAGAMPVSGQFGMTGIEIPSTELREARAIEFLKQIGVDLMTVSFGFAWRWDLDQKRMSVRDALVKVDELGGLTVAAELDSVRPSTTWYLDAQLESASLRYADASLVEHLLTFASQGNPALLRGQLIALARQQGAAAGGDRAVAEVADAIAAFLATPRGLTIDLKPPRPLPVMALATLGQRPPAALLSILGAHVTADR